MQKKKYYWKNIIVQLFILFFLIGSVLLLFVPMFFWVKELYMFFVLIILFIILSMIWPPDSPWSPWWKTSSKVARVIQRKAKITKKDLVYELGSGDAENLLTLAKEFGIKSVGVEIDPLRHYQATFRVRKNKLQDRITLYKKNFFDVDLAPATVVYVYLIPAALKRLKEKMLKELRPGTRVVSYRYTIEFLPKITKDKEEQVYVYEIPKKLQKTKK